MVSDGGMLLVRELDEGLSLGGLIGQHLSDGRGKNIQLPLTDLARRSVYSRLAGYKDVNGAERLSQNPAFRLIGSGKVLECGAALASRLQSFETELLTQPENLVGLAQIKACAMLLALACRESSHAAAVCPDAGEDRGPAATGGVYVVGADLQTGRAIGSGMERYLRKSATDGQHRGLGTAATIESAASAAGRGSQR